MTEKPNNISIFFIEQCSLVRISFILTLELIFPYTEKNNINKKKSSLVIFL